MRRAAIGGLLLAAAAPLAAHDAGSDPGGAPAWVVVAMAIGLLLYAVGVVRLHTHAARSRRMWRRRGTAFAAGWLVLAAALLSPLDALGARLFSAHMLQHELLMVIAAPLLVLGRPLGAFAWALPPAWRRGSGRVLRSPASSVAWHALSRPSVAWVLHALALWAWHVPALFGLALRDPDWHAWQHASFLGSALLFWWTVLGAPTRRAQGAAVVSLFTTMMHSGALGALLTFAAQPWYAGYAGHPDAATGLLPLEDQQLGGLLMWIPGGLVYLVAGLALAARWSGLADGRTVLSAGTPIAATGTTTFRRLQ
jgi:putative membrane protein